VKKLAGYFVKWLIFAAIWFLFVYQTSVWEALTAAGAAALTLYALEEARKHEPLRFRPRAHWVGQAWRLPKLVAVDIWILTKALGQHMAGQRKQGSFQLIPFQSPTRGPRGAAQRALVVLYGTTPPNSVVVEFNMQESYLMVHQLKETPVPRMIREIERK
jgi:multisubunit Na+/H+ antiporter MnhE subunit